MLEEVVDAHLALYAKTGASAPWIAYLARRTGTREIVGVCSVKDKCKDARVEIAYYTFTPYEGQGFGREMTHRLVDLAFRHPDVGEVIAHTLPRESASTKILHGLHFAQAGSVNDPDEGEVWLWVLTRTQSGRPPARTGVGALLTLLA
jgi:RimJ/RimL family protein N-acetyltransferase